MIHERLKPLLTRLKNPSAEAEFSLYKEFRPSAICLIEKGISLRLVTLFSENENEKLEDFILRATIVISGIGTKAEREAQNRSYLKYKIDKFIQELHDLDNAARTYLAGPVPLKGQVPIKRRRINCYKQREQAREALYTWMERHLRQSPAQKRTDKVDMLIRLFQEFFPDRDNTFFDYHISKMLAPFGVILKKRSVSARMRRDYK